MLRHIRKKTKKFAFNRKMERKMFFCARPFLDNGMYFFNHHLLTLQILRMDDISLKNFLHSFCVFCNRQNKYTGGYKFIKTRSKYILFINEIAYTIPYSLNRYKYIKNKYQKYSDILSYPHAKLLSSNDKKGIMLIERVYGSEYGDLYHCKRLIKSMIEFAIEAPLNKNDRTYLQHGDVNKGNVIWSQEEIPVFIDIDNAEFLPLLFDIIHFSAPIFTANELVGILDEYTELLSVLFKKFGIEYCHASLDLVFRDYIIWYEENCPDLKEDFYFLQHLNFNNFPITFMFIHDLFSCINIKTQF